jgi:V/A-type H+/Na+-transporting ATPase subunit C
MDRMLFTRVVPRIRVFETRLVDRAKLDRMIDSNSPEEALKILSETEYSSAIANMKRVQDYEVILGSELKRVYELMYEITPVKLLIFIMTLKYDYHNIKVLLKGRALEKDLSELLIPVGAVPLEKLANYIQGENLRDMDPLMREALEKTDEAFKASVDPQIIDILLDSFMFRDMLKKAQELGEDFLINYVRMNIDLINIKTLLRVKKQNKDREFFRQTIIDGGRIDRDILLNSLNESMDSFAGRISHTDYHSILRLGLEEYNKSGRINVFEKLSENMVMQYVKKAKYVSFGVEPVIAYLAAKEAEIKAIRIVLVGKLNKVAPELIRERLRDIYV